MTTPVLPSWLTAGRPEFAPTSPPPPVRSTAAGLTSEVAHAPGYIVLRHIAGSAVVGGAGHYLQGNVTIDADGAPALPSLWDAVRRADGTPVGAGDLRALGPVFDALRAACVSAGFGTAVLDFLDVSYRLANTDRTVALLTTGCDCDNGPAHWDCGVMAARFGTAWLDALRLTPYHYRAGSSGRAAAQSLAFGGFAGSPDELRAVVDALHAAPQGPGSSR